MTSTTSLPLDHAASGDTLWLPEIVGFGSPIIVVPKPNGLTTKSIPESFETSEHCFLGDAITLTLTLEKRVLAADYKFHLASDLYLTYGQINALAGDFYGTLDPISDGKDDVDRADRFLRAYNTLAADPDRKQPKEANDILEHFKDEIINVNDAKEMGMDPSEVWLQDSTVLGMWAGLRKLNELTGGRKTYPNFKDLVSVNWDHFGEHAHSAYNTGHAAALQKAIAGDLEAAYSMNAFADHFLQDLFSSGHLRTPRRQLHKRAIPSNAGDFCSKCMHDEDCALGLQVKNPRGDEWTAFGDMRALDAVNEDNKNHCIAAVQASADEIYYAYRTKEAPSPANYKAWTHAPTLDSARGPQTVPPLFGFDGAVRKDVTNRRLWQFTSASDWASVEIAWECLNNGWFDWPIRIDERQVVMPHSGLAVTAPVFRDYHVFHQNTKCEIIWTAYQDGFWLAAKRLPHQAVPFTPLAACTRYVDEDYVIHLFFLDSDLFLNEATWSGQGNWRYGRLGTDTSKRFRAKRNTKIAAVSYKRSGEAVWDMSVYYQGPDSDSIMEILFDEESYQWSFSGAALPTAHPGSGLAAIAYYADGPQIRLYYQRMDLYLEERCHTVGSKYWTIGEFSPAIAPRCTPITASASIDVELNVYWRNQMGEVEGRRNTAGWGWSPMTFPVLFSWEHGYQIAAAQHESTTLDSGHAKVYFQDGYGIQEMYPANGGLWVNGHVVAIGRTRTSKPWAL